MIRVSISFYNKDTLLEEEDVKILLPEDLIFKAAGTRDIVVINSYSYRR
jgi:hypothetical protein